ncbi:retrovirus-related pol polyprotein from transposon TNT 1-94, partial [Tanacetum coccineum]
MWSSNSRTGCVWSHSVRAGQRTNIRAEGTTEGEKQNKNKSKSWKIGELKYRQNIMCWNYNQKGHFQNQCSKLVAFGDKEVNMVAGDFDDALVCCVENTVEDCIIDSSASFHANYCKGDLERFNLCSGKDRLVDDMTLDITSVGDVVLKTSFGTSWTLKDVRYIPSLKRRLISVRQLDEEVYHVGLGDQQWKVTKGSLVVARGNKRGSLYMVEVYPEVVGTIIDGSGSAALWFGEAEESFFHNVSEDKETAKVKHLKFDNGGEYSSLPIKFCVKNGIVMLKMVPETPLQFGVAERLSQTFRVESTRIHVEASKMLWADSVKGVCGEAMKCTFIGSGSDEMRYSFWDTKSHQVIRSRDITFVDSIKGSRSATDSSSLTKPIQESQVVLVDIPKNLTENDSIVAEHGLSLEITQSPGRSSDMSEGSENSRSFQDSGRSYKEDSEDGASSKKMVSLEKNQTCSLVRILAEKKASQRLWMFKVKEEHDGSKRYKALLVVKGFQHKWVLSNCKDDYNQVDDMLVAGSDMAEFNKPK